MNISYPRLDLKPISALTNHFLADVAYRIEGQPMFKVLERIEKLEQQGEDIIHFEIGDPDFNTPRHIIEAAYSSMKNGETHYTNSMGLRDLRVAVCEANMFTRGFKLDISQVLIAPGANIIIYLAVRCLANPGESRTSGVSFPDASKIANAYGIKFVRISDNKKLDEALDGVLDYDGPVICEIMAQVDQMIIPTMASEKKDDGTVVAKPMEDMYPFLDRKEFKSIMIVKPLK